MSTEEPRGLLKHSQTEQEEKITPKDFTLQEQSRLVGASANLVAAKRKNEDTDAVLNEDKESGCESSVRADDEKTYFKSKKFSKAKAITKVERVDNSDNIHSKTELVGEQVLQRKSEFATITRGHLQSGVGNSATEGQATMGSMVCGYSDRKDKAEKSEGIKKRKRETSDDFKNVKQPSLQSERHRSSNNGKKLTQPTLHHYQIQTRATQKMEQEKTQKAKFRKHFVDRDTENYRSGYPGMEDNPCLNDNLRFYRGEIMSVPKGAYIDDIHKKWWGNYELLESHHGYIQWLFPIRESGMNSKAQPLQLHEAKAIKADVQARNRVLVSYKLMLDFYGMELEDDRTGKLKRSKNWRKCYDNLNRSSHNYLRITRILKCLGELGYEYLKKEFIQFVLEEALIHHTLGSTLTSCRDYWIGTIKDYQDREDLYQFVDEHQGGSNL